MAKLIIFRKQESIKQGQKRSNLHFSLTNLGQIVTGCAVKKILTRWPESSSECPDVSMCLTSPSFLPKLSFDSQPRQGSTGHRNTKLPHWEINQDQIARKEIPPAAQSLQVSWDRSHTSRASSLTQIHSSSLFHSTLIIAHCIGTNYDIVITISHS